MRPVFRARVTRIRRVGPVICLRSRARVAECADFANADYEIGGIRIEIPYCSFIETERIAPKGTLLMPQWTTHDA